MSKKRCARQCRGRIRLRRNYPDHRKNLNQGKQCPNYLEFVAPPRFPYLRSVVSRFRTGYFRDCSARPPELMYSQETDVSSGIGSWSPSASSIPVHRVIDIRTRSYRVPQIVWIHLKILHSSCAALRVTRLHQETLLKSCRMLGEKEVLMTCLFGVGAWYAHQERALPRNNVLRCFPPTAALPRHTWFGHHPTRMSMIMSATGPAYRCHLQPSFRVSEFLI